jgi:hypothetical protein
MDSPDTDRWIPSGEAHPSTLLSDSCSFDVSFTPPECTTELLNEGRKEQMKTVVTLMAVTMVYLSSLPANAQKNAIQISKEQGCGCGDCHCNQIDSGADGADVTAKSSTGAKMNSKPSSVISDQGQLERGSAKAELRSQR